MAEIDTVVTDVSPADKGVAIYRFKNGEIGTLFNGSTTVAAVNTTKIYGDEGTLIQDYGDYPSTAVPRPDDPVALKFIRKGDDQWTELRMPKAQSERIASIPRPFIDYLRGLTNKTISSEECRTSVEMVLGAYLSNTQGRRITFPLKAP